MLKPISLLPGVGPRTLLPLMHLIRSILISLTSLTLSL